MSKIDQLKEELSDALSKKNKPPKKPEVVEFSDQIPDAVVKTIQGIPQKLLPAILKEIGARVERSLDSKYRALISQLERIVKSDEAKSQALADLKWPKQIHIDKITGLDGLTVTAILSDKTVSLNPEIERKLLNVLQQSEITPSRTTFTRNTSKQITKIVEDFGEFRVVTTFNRDRDNFVTRMDTVVER